MKNWVMFLGLFIMISALSIPAYAAGEASEAVVPVKTLADFQKENPGKMIVGWYKYEQYKEMLEKAPRPTLEASRIRTEVSEGKTLADFQRENPGKPIVGWYKYEEHKKANQG